MGPMYFMSPNRHCQNTEGTRSTNPNQCPGLILSSLPLFSWQKGHSCFVPSLQHHQRWIMQCKCKFLQRIVAIPPNVYIWIIIDAGGRGNISWEFVHGLLELAIYGGRVDNSFDSRVLMSYLKQFFNSEVIGEQNRGSRKLGPMTIPTSTQYRVS